MKKTIGLLLVVGLLVGILATAAFAATPGDGIRDLIGAGNRHALGAEADHRGDNFVDADNDGVCDNYVDDDGDGINDLRATLGGGGFGPHGSGNCDASGFVDEDGDGVCDNAGSGGGQMRMGGNGQGNSPGRTR
jgi:hypothetical protein